MRNNIDILLLFFIGCTVSKGLECDIETLPSLEESILKDEYNIQSLTRAFYPQNTAQPFVVEVNYYINRTIHPLEEGIGDNTTADFVFLWLSSSILTFFPPRYMEFISLSLLEIGLEHVHINIGVVCEDDTEDVTHFLSYTTTWMKSYAENRKSTIEDGLDPGSRGFSTYVESGDNDAYSIIVEDNNRFNVIEIYYSLFTGLSYVAVLVFVFIASSTKIDQYYPTLHQLSVRNKVSNEKFKFRNLMWGILFMLVFIIVGIYFVLIWKYVTFGRKWKTTKHNFVFPIFLGVYSILPILTIIASLVLASKAWRKKTMIALPALLYNVMGARSPENGHCGSNDSIKQQRIQFIWQVIGNFIFITAASAFSVFVLGILLALFVDPTRVITLSALYVCVMFFVVIFFAYIFEMREKIGTNQRTKRSSCFRLCIMLLALVLSANILIMYGYTYSTLVFFKSDDDKFDLFTSIGQLIPIILTSAIGWVLKKELAIYSLTDEDYTETLKK